MFTIFGKLSNKIFKSLSRKKNENKELKGAQQKLLNKERVYCRFCGKYNPGSQENCLGCGRRFGEVEPYEHMKECHMCGLTSRDDSTYCLSCGMKFDENGFI